MNIGGSKFTDAGVRQLRFRPAGVERVPANVSLADAAQLDLATISSLHKLHFALAQDDRFPESAEANFHKRWPDIDFGWYVTQEFEHTDDYR